MDKTYSKLLPDGLVAYENQVAGHSSKDERSPTGILKTADGFILKPVVKHPQTESEIGFYESVANDPKFACFRKFVPEYKGIIALDIQGIKINFLKIQDLANGFVKPCVMDVKIGHRTWDPNASDVKRKTEEEKYNASKEIFGFCIPGYQVYKLSTGSFVKMGKEEGRKLDKISLPLALKEFFNVDSIRSNHLMNRFLDRLDGILKMWEEQTIVHIYSSSLLFTYDAHQLELSESNLNEGPQPSDWINIMMIDFAHVVPANNALDDNYLSGVRNLIQLLRNFRIDE